MTVYLNETFLTGQARLCVRGQDVLVAELPAYINGRRLWILTPGLWLRTHIYDVTTTRTV